MKPITQSEGTKKEKDKAVYSLIYVEFRKMAYTHARRRDKHLKNTLLDSVGEGEGGMI